MDVGLRELKERLSELLDRASRGEVIRVTDRGRPKAILAPIPGRSMLEDGAPLETALQLFNVDWARLYVVELARVCRYRGLSGPT